MQKVILVAAPVSHYPVEEVKNPTTAEEVGRTVIECAEAGAGMVHLHVRDKDGCLTDDMTVFTKTLDVIQEGSNIVIQASTGGSPGSSATIKDRVQALNDARVEVASLNMGSVNLSETPFINAGSDIREWAEVMRRRGVLPELEIFEVGMLEMVKRMADEGFLRPPYLCAFCPGYSLPAIPDVLFFGKSMLPSNSLWGLNHHGMRDFSLSITAVGMGASFVRVGFEDGIYYAPGRVAKSNADLVRRMGDVIRRMGRDIAAPEDVRSILRLGRST